MKRILMILACACLLTACDKDENEDIIAHYFFGNPDDPNKPNPDDNEDNGQVPMKGLVAYYPFDGNTQDASGNSLSARIAGSVKVTTGHNSESRCAYFPGDKSSYLYVPFSDKLQLNEWTINLWFYYENTSNREGALMQMGRENVPGTFFVGMNVVHFINSKGVAQYGTLYESEKQFPSVSEWHMLTTSVKGVDVALYFDGRLVWKNTLSSKYVNQVANDLIIGASQWYGSIDLPFEGRIDDVRIYNRILSDKEVEILYKN